MSFVSVAQVKKKFRDNHRLADKRYILNKKSIITADLMEKFHFRPTSEAQTSREISEH